MAAGAGWLGTPWSRSPLSQAKPNPLPPPPRIPHWVRCWQLGARRREQTQTSKLGRGPCFWFPLPRRPGRRGAGSDPGVLAPVWVLVGLKSPTGTGTVGPGPGGGSTAASAALRLDDPGRERLACALLRLTFDLTLLDPITHWHTHCPCCILIRPGARLRPRILEDHQSRSRDGGGHLSVSGAGGLHSRMFELGLGRPVLACLKGKGEQRKVGANILRS